MNKLILTLFVLGSSSLLFGFGEDVYEKYKCGICHGEKAEKRSLGVSKIISGWKEESVINAIKGYKDKSRSVYGFGSMMSGKVVNLNDQEVTALAKYISSLEVIEPEVAQAVEAAKPAPEEKTEDNTTIQETAAQVQEPEPEPTPEPVAEPEPVAKLEPTPEPEPVPEPKTEIAEQKPALVFVEYIVKNGDSLASISRKNYNSLYFWPIVYSKNKHLIKNQNYIAPKLTFSIPKNIDMENEEVVDFVIKSYIDAYRNYKKIRNTDDARWLLYACYKYLTPKIVEDYKHLIDSDDLEK
ncbi:MAG: cytochrome c, partial [Campylobacterota bacterium]|nr:cytochrome c [Campylobacterota bacterium]